MALTKRQTDALAERGLRWLDTIERLNDFERFNQSSTKSDDVHLLMLALKHFSNCVEKLDLQLADEFTEAWRYVSRVRDMLEHEEEYIAGPGKFPDQVHPQWAEAGHPEAWIAYAEGLISVAVVGGNYPVVEPIRLALSLRPSLEEIVAREETA